MSDKYKMVIVVRTDLKMSVGKLSAQVGHAAVSCVIEAMKNSKHREWLEKWLSEGQKKVILKVESFEELIKIYNQAMSRGLPVCLIRDAGLTELAPGTTTCVGIGPGPEEEIDSITGKLGLL